MAFNALETLLCGEGYETRNTEKLDDTIQGNNKKKNDCYIHATFRKKILNCSGIRTRLFLSYLQWLEKVSAHTFTFIFQ